MKALSRHLKLHFISCGTKHTRAVADFLTFFWKQNEHGLTFVGLALTFTDMQVIFSSVSVNSPTDSSLSQHGKLEVLITELPPLALWDPSDSDTDQHWPLSHHQQSASVCTYRADRESTVPCVCVCVFKAVFLYGIMAPPLGDGKNNRIQKCAWICLHWLWNTAEFSKNKQISEFGL